LSQSVVDFVASGMVEIFSLQPDVSSTGMLSQSFSKMQLTGSPHPGVICSILLPKCRIILDLVEAFLEF
jgi:hypothetical protein